MGGRGTWTIFGRTASATLNMTNEVNSRRAMLGQVKLEKYCSQSELPER